jgi:hypothetical protein
VIVSECNNCKRLDPRTPPPDWLIVLGGDPPSSPLAGLLGGGPEIKAMFCGLRCMAVWATDKVLTGLLDGPQQIEGGTGWPG